MSTMLPPMPLGSAHTTVLSFSSCSHAAKTARTSSSRKGSIKEAYISTSPRVAGCCGVCCMVDDDDDDEPSAALSSSSKMSVSNSLLLPPSSFPPSKPPTAPPSKAPAASIVGEPLPKPTPTSLSNESPSMVRPPETRSINDSLLRMDSAPPISSSLSPFSANGGMKPSVTGRSVPISLQAALRQFEAPTRLNPFTETRRWSTLTIELAPAFTFSTIGKPAQLNLLP
mmetsp:Transcript_56325/g.112835  ORF Transcript_56325/g.112835 Transcript_56325/m.112835 type:complete len:227 (+) Transcript_56325:899-1579(+)